MNLADAERIGAELADALADCCTRPPLVVGSTRRRCATVKDVELVLAPALVPDPMPRDLFSCETEMINLVRQKLAEWRRTGRLVPRLNLKGQAAWGERYVRAWLVEGKQRTAVDLFSVLPPASYGLTVLIRTGDSVFSERALARWKTISGGHSADGHLVDAAGVAVKTNEEADVFRALAWKWIPPEARSLKARPAAAPELPARAESPEPERVPLFCRHEWTGPLVDVPDEPGHQLVSCGRCGELHPSVATGSFAPNGKGRP